MTTEPSEGFEPLVYLAVIYRWKWPVVAVTVLCAALGLAYLTTLTPQYQATAQLLYVQPVTVPTSLVQGGVPYTLQQPNLATVSAVITSSQLGSAAARLLGGRDTSAGYNVAVPIPSGGNAATAGGQAANVVAIEVVSSSPQTAAAVADAYAQAFVDYRRETARTQVSSVLMTVKAALLSYETPSSKKSAEYLQLVQSKRDLQLQLETLAADYRLTASVTPPSAPFLPRRLHTLAYFTILGLLLGMGFAFLLENLDTRPRDETEVADLLGLPVLGQLPQLPRSIGEASTLQVLVDPVGPMAEAVRVLRSNIGFANVDGDVRTLLVSSSIRSEGKSVTACNLAVAMALAGQRVVLVDADLRRPRVHTLMHLSNAVGLSSVLARRVDLGNAVVSITLDDAIGAGAAAGATPIARRPEASGRMVSLASSGSGSDAVAKPGSWPPGAPLGPDESAALRVLPSGPLPPNPGEMAASERFGELIGMLADTADLVIIDSPPLLEVGDAAAMAPRCDGLVFVANMARVRWPMLERLQAQLMTCPCRTLGLVVVRAKRTSKPAYRYRYGSVPGSTLEQGRS